MSRPIIEIQYIPTAYTEGKVK